MLTALINGKIVNCFDGKYSKDDFKSWANKEIIKCPVCGEKYNYCHGKVRYPYFKHFNNCDCESYYYEEETQEHIKGKIDIFKWISNQDGITNVELEKWIPETKQRPDIYFEHNGLKYVIEYQCTPISTEFIDRHNLYSCVGIRDIWICGYDKYFVKNARGKYIENYASGYYDVNKKEFIYSKSNVINRICDERLFRKHKSYKKEEDFLSNILYGTKFVEYIGIVPLSFRGINRR